MAGFLSYSQKNHCNIVPKEEFEDLVQTVFNVISDNLCKSLGPLGSSATILDGSITEATKDGYAILKKYCFTNQYKRLIYNLIMRPCTTMNNTVGDGTTTAIAFTNELFNSYKSQKVTLKDLYYLPRDFTKAWDECVNDIIDEIKKRAIPLTSKDVDKIYNIAYVTSNGNEEISKQFSEIYSDENLPTIKKKRSPSNKSFFKKIDGYDFNGNLIDAAYTNSDDLSIELPSAYVMIFDRSIDIDTFNDIIIPLNELCIASNKKLIILASKYENQLCETILKQYIIREKRLLNTINLYLVQFSNSKLKEYHLNDLSIILNCKVINNDLFMLLKERLKSKMLTPEQIFDECLKNELYELYGIIGSCKSSNLTCKDGCLFRIDETIYNSRLEDVKKLAKIELDNIITSTEFERHSYSEKIFDAKNRINQLNMNNYIYYVGANSELQRQVLEDSVDDVIKCLESSFKYGIVPGSQLTIIKAANDLRESRYGQKVRVPYNFEILSEAQREYYQNLPKESILTKPEELRMRIFRMISYSAAKVFEHVLSGPEGLTLKPIVEKFLNIKENNPFEKVFQENRKITYEDIIDISKEKNTPFNLETLDWDENIITSAQTDIMILLVASELIKILISGNQCIIYNSDMKDTDNIDMSAYED